MTGIAELQGDVAAAVACLRRAWETELTEAPTQTGPVLTRLLTKLPPSLQGFTAARIAAPRLERLEDAQSQLEENLERWRARALQRERTAVVAELQRSNAAGELEQGFETLRRRQAALKERTEEMMRRARGRTRT